MRTQIFAFSLLLSSPASAGWTVIDKFAEVTLYADTESVRFTAGTAKMWILIDYKKEKAVGTDRFLSRVKLEEFDCIERRSRVLQNAGYTGNMRSGNLVFHDSTPYDWGYVEPNTVAENLLNLACRRVGK